jgi:CHAT domain-containing protein
MLNSTEETSNLHPITYVNIGRELALIPTFHEEVNLSHTLIIGNPKVHRLTDLPFASYETSFTGELLHAPVYQGKDASIELFYKEDLKPPLLHIAAHGFINKSNQSTTTEKPTKSCCNYMNECGLFLADEYPLTADKISSLQLSSVKLCILSACYSGLGKSNGNEGSFGLRRGFFLAGCKNLLTCLWSIHDFSGMLFIQCFLLSLIKNHNNTFEALQDAQSNMRTRTIDEWKPIWQEIIKIEKNKMLLEAIQAYLYQSDDYIPFAHPYYWAGFQLTGNPVSFV